MNAINLHFPPQIWKSFKFTAEEKLILTLVYNFQVKRGYAYATDYWISDTFGINLNDVSKLVAELSSIGYINIWYEEDTRCMSLNLSRMEEDLESYSDPFADFQY